MTRETIRGEKLKPIAKGWYGMEQGVEWQWLEDSNYIFQESLSLVTRTLCGLLATCGLHREMPDMQD